MHNILHNQFVLTLVFFQHGGPHHDIVDNILGFLTHQVRRSVPNASSRVMEGIRDFLSHETRDVHEVCTLPLPSPFDHTPIYIFQSSDSEIHSMSTMNTLVAHYPDTISAGTFLISSQVLPDEEQQQFSRSISHTPNSICENDCSAPNTIQGTTTQSRKREKGPAIGIDARWMWASHIPFDRKRISNLVSVPRHARCCCHNTSANEPCLSHLLSLFPATG